MPPKVRAEATKRVGMWRGLKWLNILDGVVAWSDIFGQRFCMSN
jgi:hypothetical protein